MGLLSPNVQKFNTNTNKAINCIIKSKNTVKKIVNWCYNEGNKSLRLGNTYINTYINT